MKKNYVFRTAMCLGVAVMLTLCGASGTYAKYTGTITGGADTARVAKFDFIFGKNDTDNVKYSVTQSYTVDIFNSNIKDTNGTAEDDIDAGVSEVIIAPGSWGYIPIYIENKAEVTVEATLKSTIENASSVPITFGVISGTSEPTIANLNDCDADTATALDNKLQTAFSGDIETSKRKSNNNNIKQGFLIWNWRIGTSDDENNADTPLGVAGTATVSVKINCTATQVD